MSNPTGTQPPSTAVTPEDRWRECVEQWYPHRLRQTYFLPPYHFRRTNYDVVNIPDVPYSILQHPTPLVLPAPATVSLPSASGATASSSLHPATPLTQPSLPVAPLPNASGATAGPPLHPPTTTPQPSLPVAPLPNASGATAGPPLHPPTTPPQPPLPVAGSVFTVRQGAPASLPVYQGSDFVDDEAMERLVDCLRRLSENKTEPMLVISQLEFRRYLDGCVDPMRVIEKSYRDKLPRPINLPPQFHDGDFDVLVVHRDYGLMVLEVKAVGATRGPSFNLQNAVQNKVEKAVKQLNKAETMLRHLLSDRHDLAGVRITKSIVLPNITSTELKAAVVNNRTLEQDLCTALGAADLAAAADRCLCKDRFPSACLSQTGQPSRGASRFLRAVRRWVQRKRTVRPLRSWWQLMTSKSLGPDQAMTKRVYDDLLARFCGPATSVEIPTVTAPCKAVKTIRTEGEAVAETGLILSLLALYPEQITLLGDPCLRCLHLNGAPGTGKTVMLVVKAMQLLHRGTNVLILCSHEGGRPVSLLIERQLNHALGPNPSSTMGTVTRRDLKDVRDAGSGEFKALVSAGKLFIIADEIIQSLFFGEREMPADLKSFIKKVQRQVSDLWVWCASVPSCPDLPQGMAARSLSVALRTPPAVTAVVQRQLEAWRSDWGGGPEYSPQRTPATDGPSVREWPQSGDWEDSASAVQDVGRRVVELLAELGVGSGPDALQYRDVVILADGLTETALPGISAALRAGGVPCQTLGDDCSAEDVGLALTDSVTLARDEHVPGLERRVVVVLESVTGFGLYNWLALSRCTGLLVRVGTYVCHAAE